VLARIIDNRHIYLEQLTSDNEDVVKSHFSVLDPRARYSTSDWDGWVRKYNQKHARLELSFLDELKICCEQNRIPLEISDERPAPKYPAPNRDQITETLLDGITLLKYQVDALKVCCEKEIGIIKSTTGSGKTEVACGLIKMFRCPTVVITEQVVVLEQIVERVNLRNVVHNNDVGMFCFGNMPNGNQVIIGSIQSLSSPTKPEFDDICKKMKVKRALSMLERWLSSKSENALGHIRRALPTAVGEALLDNPEAVSELSGPVSLLLRNYCAEVDFEIRMKAYKTRLEHAREIQGMVSKCDLLLVDEVDLATTKQYAKLFKRYFKGRRKFGFSATPYERSKPVKNLILKEHMGSIISETSREEVQAAGRIIPIRMFFIAIEDGDRRDGRAYDIALKEDIVDNDDFHSLVATIPLQFGEEGTLILIDTSPIEPLGFGLQEHIPGSVFIYGKSSKKYRRECVEAFERRDLKCLIGSKIVGRGFDLKCGVENLVIIGGGGQWSQFDQKVGRSVRRNKRGWARVFGFFHLTNKYLYKHSRENLKTVVEMGYPTKVITSKAEIDGKKFIKSRYKIPKK